MPGWTVYHAIVTSNTNIRKTNIGYCPKVPAPATEFDDLLSIHVSRLDLKRIRVDGA